MWRGVIGAVAALLLCTPVCAAAGGTGDSITLRTRSDGGTLLATYHLKQPTKTLCFPAEQQALTTHWTPRTPSLHREGPCFTSERSFTTATIEVGPDPVSIDRIYPAVTRLGAMGWLVHAPSLTPSASRGLFHVAFEASIGQRVIGAQDGGGYLALTTASDSIAQSSQVVVADGVPPWLGELVRDQVEAIGSFYGEIARVKGRTAPPIFVSLDPKGATSWRGDADAAGAISMRFSGDWKAPAGGWVVSKFIAHELFHRWMADWGAQGPGESESWLYEGAAEMAALLYLRHSGAMSDEDLRAQLETRLNGCVKSWGGGGLQAVALRRGEGVYDCGVTMQWVVAATAGMRSQSLLEVWSRTLKSAQRGGSRYSARSFGRMAGWPALGDTSADALLTNAIAKLRGAGAEISDAPDDNDYVEAVVLPLMRSSCPEAKTLGYYSLPTGLKLDTRTGCGPLDAAPVVVKIAGADIVQAPAEAFEAANGECARTSHVSLLLEGGTAVSASCPARGFQSPGTEEARRQLEDYLRRELCGPANCEGDILGRITIGGIPAALRPIETKAALQDICLRSRDVQVVFDGGARKIVCRALPIGKGRRHVGSIGPIKLSG